MAAPKLLNSSILPFGKALTEEHIFEYDQLKELKQIVEPAIAQKSPALVTGQAGVGKTTAVKTVTSQLPTNKYIVVYLGQDQDGSNLLHRLAYALGLNAKPFRKQTLMQISRFLNDNLIEQGKTPVVIIDEAHLLEDVTLEDLRLFTNADFDTTSPLALILLGQLQLRTRLKSPHFEALNQRLLFRCTLEGFSQEETTLYIQHHLKIAGLPATLFAPDAAKQIFFASGGIPREINNIALAAFLNAKSSGIDNINAKLIKHVLDQRDLS